MEVPIVNTLKYLLLDHPSIVWFRWSPTQSWGSTWPFLVMAIILYITLIFTLQVILKICRCYGGVPLGHLPAVHSLAMSLVSATIFVGTLLSAATELRETRWLWRRTRTTSLEWFLCFPLGTRPAGRVFFWSYVFYLSRFLHLVRTFLAVLRRRRVPFFRVLNNSMVVVMSFLWLEFSQSFQVVAILLWTLVYAAVYGYRFWTEIGLARKGFSFPASCQMVVLGCNLVCHVAVLCLHFLRGGCNGIGAWLFNSVLNAAILFLFFKSYVNNMYSQNKIL